MLAKTDVARIYETVLSIPGMNDKVKIALNIPRKNILLLSKVIERGLSARDSDDGYHNVLEVVSHETLLELQALPADLLERAGLTEMNEKLEAL